MIIMFLLFVNSILILNIYFLNSQLIGVVFLCLYLFSNGYFVGCIIHKFFNIKDKFIRLGLGIFLVFSLISLLGSIFIVFYKFNDFILSSIIIFVSLFCWLNYKKYFNPKNILISRFFNFKNLKLYFNKIFIIINQKIFQFNPKFYLTPLYLSIIILFTIGFYTVFASSALDKYIITPWQIIPSQFVWVIVLLSILILGFIFFRPKRFLLLLIILFSLLIHLYIPSVYRLPYTGDSWRHIGSMQQISEQGQLKVNDNDYVSIGPIFLSHTIITVPSYSAFWAGTLFLHKILHIDFVSLSVWWQYVFFSIFAPLLTFVLLSKVFSSIVSDKTIYPPRRIGGWRVYTKHTPSSPLKRGLCVSFPILSWGRGLRGIRSAELICSKNQIALLGSFLISLFFSWQIYGAISLPVGFGFLFFLFFLITVVLYLQTHKRILFIILLLEFSLMFFSYVVYWLISGLILGFIIVQRLTEMYQYSFKKKLLRIFYLIISISLIPIVSLFVSPNARFDILKTGPGFFIDFWRHTLLSFLSLKGIENLNLSSGNFIWNSTRGYFVNISPFNFEYFDTLLMLGILIIIFFGFFLVIGFIARDIDKNKIFSLILYLLYIGLGSIFIDYYYFGGIHLLAERLDLVISLSLLLIILLGVIHIFICVETWKNHNASKNLIENKKSTLSRGLQSIQLTKWMHFNLRRSFNTVIIFLVILFSFTIGSSYTSGPIHGRVTENQYIAMQKLYQDIRNSHNNYCVISEHFPLTALEAISAGQIKQGRFPIKYGYLSESGNVFIKMFSNPNIKWIKQALKITKSNGCYFVIDDRFMADWSIGAINKVLGKPILQVDEVYVWRYDE